MFHVSFYNRIILTIIIIWMRSVCCWIGCAVVISVLSWSVWLLFVLDLYHVSLEPWWQTWLKTACVCVCLEVCFAPVRCTHLLTRSFRWHIACSSSLVHSPMLGPAGSWTSVWPGKHHRALGYCLFNSCFEPIRTDGCHTYSEVDYNMTVYAHHFI